MPEQSQTMGVIRKATGRVGFVTEVMAECRSLIEPAQLVFVKPYLVSHEPRPTTMRPRLRAFGLRARKACGQGAAGGSSSGVDGGVWGRGD